VVLSPIAALLLDGRLYRTPAATTIDGRAAEAPGWTGGGVAVAWWYLYAFAAGDALGFLFSQTPPDDARVFRQGGTTHRYLGCAYSAARDHVAGFAAERGSYLLATPVPIVSAARAPAPTRASLAGPGLLPPHARRARLGARVQSENDFATIDLLVRNGADPAAGARAVVSVPPRGIATTEFDVATDDARAFRWSTSPDGGPGHPTTLTLVGFDEGT
jgi:hypothetical protein